MAAKRAFTNKLEAYKTEPKGKVPPNNMEAEQCLLGSVLLKHEVFDSVAAIVTPPDFYEPRHILICETMKELYSQSRSIDSLTVAESLATKGQPEQVGGVSYVSSDRKSTRLNSSHA